MTDQELGIFKQAVAAAPRAPAAPAKIWRVINRPNAQAAVAFINLPPAQGAGEAAFSDLDNGTVDTYYFL